MAGKDRALDPLTGDYVPDGKGGWKYTTLADTKCYHQLKTARNTWPGDPDAGSDYALLDRKDTDEEIARAADMTRDALQPLLDLNLIADLKLETGRDEGGRPVIQSTVTDTQSGAEVELTALLPYGP